MIPNDDNKNNVYAYNVYRKIIHVSIAESGRKGYFCLGCEKEMQEVISHKGDRISYFRHDPKFVDLNKKCTYSDESYRHKLAKEILQRIKTIKVPPLYKYPPNNLEGSPILISEAKFINAHLVKIELQFFEDENGDVKFGHDTNTDAKYLLIKPDITFFDKNGNPVLLIELVATHKITNEKKARIHKLGIDTVQVSIPKSSPEEIEGCFYHSKNTKWIYSYEQTNTEYISISESNSIGVSQIDELQRELFEESFICRTAQINNLLRSIKRCLESKPYRETESRLRSELSRVKKNSDRNREQLSELQDRFQDEIESEFRERFEEIKRDKDQFIKEQAGVEEEYRKLEKRYHNKARELEEEKRFLESRVHDETRTFDERGRSFDEKERELEFEERRIIEDIKRERSLVEEFRNRTRKQPEILRGIEGSIRDKFESLEAEQKFEIEEIERRRNELPKEFEGKRTELENRYFEIRAGIAKSFEQRDFNSNSEFSRKCNEVVKNRELYEHFKETYFANKRLRTAWELLRSGAYKNWYE